MINKTVAKDALPSVREMAEQNGLIAKKNLGQNFIFDSNILDKIVRCSFSSDENIEDFSIIEIGPGPAGLTRALLSAGVKDFTVVERDERCQKILEQVQRVYPDNLNIIFEDALAVKVNELGKAPRKIIANLPYNISTVLLLTWLKSIKDFAGFCLMFQKEVAERMVAKPSSPDYGRLSIMVQWLCEVEIKMILKPEVFSPPPKVSSALVYLRPREKPLAKASFETLEKVTAVAFNQRRKMLRSSLKSFGEPEELCRVAGVDSSLRAENVSIEAYCAMAEYLKEKGKI